MEETPGENLSDIEVLAPWAREGLIDFAIATDPSYDPSWHHELIAQKLEAVERGEIKRLIISMPPRHGKSELVSIKFPAWYMGKHPDRSFIQTGYAAELAEDFGSKTRNLIADTRYQKIFPGLHLAEDTNSKKNWRLWKEKDKTGERDTTVKEGSYFAAGVGGPITGRGAHVLVIDDPIKNREEAESEVIQEKIWSWWTSTARTRLEGNGAVIIVMTRWSTKDLVGRLLAQAPEDWDLLELPAIAEENEEYRKIGEALWPQKYTIEDLRHTEKEVTAKEWLALYQQHPVDSLTQEIKEEWFRYFDEDDISDKLLNVWITCDPAIAEKDEACNTSIWVVGKEVGSSSWYLLEESTGHYDPAKFLDEFFRLVRFYKYSNEKRYRLIKTGVEDVLFQKVLIYLIKEKQKAEELFFEIVGLKASGRKEARIRGLIPYWKRGNIFHRRIMKELEGEALGFPTAKLRDRLDALSYQPQIQEGHEESYGRDDRKPGADAMEKRMRERIKKARNRAVI